MISEGVYMFFKFMAVFLILFLILFVIGLICLILKTIGVWKILVKGKEEGWKSLIPLYNKYTLCDIVGINHNWIFIIIGCFICLYIPIIRIAAIVAFAYFNIILNKSLANSFGKSISFAIGLIVLPPIFYYILGIGKSEYQGPTPVHDIVFNDWFKQDAKATSKENNRICPHCHATIVGDSVFCSACGNKVN